MKIAIFSDTFFPQSNGVAHVAYDSARSLAELNHDIMVVTVSQNGAEDLREIAEGKFELVVLPSLPAPAYKGERFTFPFGLALKRIKKFNPDIIHAHTPFSVGWEAVLASKIIGAPLVGTHHTFFDHYLKHVNLDYQWMKKPSWLYAVAYYNRCHLVLSSSRALADGMKKHGLKSPVKILANSIDTNFFKPARSLAQKKKIKSKFGIDNEVIVYVGRVSYEKSLDQLMKAMTIVGQKLPKAKFLIVGDGPERRNLERLANDLGIKNRVIFTGTLGGERWQEAFQAGDVFWTASKSENMPLTILEAMASGLPVVGVNALGIPEIVKDNVNGFIVPPDQPEEMSKKIIELVKNGELLKKFSGASRKLALNYSQEKITASLARLYEELIENQI